MQPTESAVIVAIPEAEAAVSRWRLRLDPSAARGVPAHVTLLYPFVRPDAIDAAVLGRLACAIAEVPAFDVGLEHTAWFGDKVVWLAPRPTEPFRTLTTHVWQRFPQCPPYDGAHSEVIPHLTIGDGAPLTDLQEAERAISADLPIRGRVTHARLICGSAEPDSWQRISEFPLG